MAIPRILPLPALVCLLAACTPHPGSGNWQSTGEANPRYISEFVRLEVGYDGRTDIFGDSATPQASADDTNGAIRHCFWGGLDAHAITLDCVQAANTDVKESYSLRVSADKRTAELIKDEVVVGRFVRQ